MRSNSSAAVKMDPNSQLLLSEVIGALSFALDLTEGQPQGHCLRSCLIGMHIGRTLGFNLTQMYDLYYMLLLKDAGCSSNAARLCQLYGTNDLVLKGDFRAVDSQSLPKIAQFVLSHTKMSGSLKDTLGRVINLASNGEDLAKEVVTTRCERGAEIAHELGFNQQVADGIRSLDEHWNGKGRPMGLMGKMIPVFSQIALLAQIIDVFHTMGGPERALSEVSDRSGIWFNPEFCVLFTKKVATEDFWKELLEANTPEILRRHGFEPQNEDLGLSEDRLDRIANAFAKIVDAKSSYTFGHSSRVAIYSDGIAEQLKLDETRRRWLKRAALLHDLGKLAVSNVVLDKPAKLSDEEWKSVRLHPHFTEVILSKITPLKELAVVAGAHHERLDGKGYPNAKRAEQISLDTRIITVADVYDAITANRPYRGPIPPEEALEIMERDRNTAFDPACLDALIARIK